VTVEWLAAGWPAPDRVRAGTTTRRGGASRPPFDSLNLAEHVGDDPDAVRRNRAALQRALALPAPPQWLQQTHSNRVIRLPQAGDRRADAVVTDSPGVVLAILTADCVPVLLCAAGGTRIAAVHAGWRGLVAGILENTLGMLDHDPADLLAWLGPHIGATAYEVGDDVREACLVHLPGAASAFSPNTRGRWQCNLNDLVHMALRRAGVGHIDTAGRCTYSEADRFYSYRQVPRTGRMATLIWMDR